MECCRNSQRQAVDRQTKTCRQRQIGRNTDRQAGKQGEKQRDGRTEKYRQMKVTDERAEWVQRWMDDHSEANRDNQPARHAGRQAGRQAGKQAASQSAKQPGRQKKIDTTVDKCGGTTVTPG